MTKDVKAKQDDELLTVARMERMLAKLPDEAARQRVLAYLVSRHQVQQQPAKPLQLGGCNAVPLVPGREHA